MKTITLVEKPKLQIQDGDDGVWLLFATINGLHSAINLHAFFGRMTSIRDEAIVQWAREYAQLMAQETAQRAKSVPQAIIAAIDSERAHQESRFPHNHTPGEYILILRKVLADAERVWYHNPEHVMAEIRQVVAVGVKAMEEYGAPLRESTTQT